ncbi:MAG: ABC transporter permease [Ferruginibacter sp.]
MLKLLKIEWLKIKNYNAFIVLVSFFALGVVASNFIVYSTFNNSITKSAGVSMIMAAFNPYSFYNTWQTTSYVAGWILMLPSLLLIILVTNEFTYRTNRQNIIDGWSRNQFTSVKMMMALIAAILSTVLVFITALVFGAASHTDFSFNGISHVGFFFLKALSYNMLAIFMAVLIRRTGFAIAVFFIYMGAENIISQLLDVWSVKLRTQDNLDLGSMGDYLPMGASDGLLTFPKNNLRDIASSAFATNFTWLVLGIALAYLFIFYFFGKRRMLRSDL